MGTSDHILTGASVIAHVIFIRQLNLQSKPQGFQDKRKVYISSLVTLSRTQVWGGLCILVAFRSYIPATSLLTPRAHGILGKSGHAYSRIWSLGPREATLCDFAVSPGSCQEAPVQGHTPPYPHIPSEPSADSLLSPPSLSFSSSSSS